MLQGGDFTRGNVRLLAKTFAGLEEADISVVGHWRKVHLGREVPRRELQAEA
jgi:hypothetical protein